MVVLQYPVARICSPLISSSIVLNRHDGGRRQRGMGVVLRVDC